MTLLIRRGDRSVQVADVQARVRGLGIPIDDDPGVFGEGTERAVRAFQQRRGLLVDGIVGPNTWDELVEAGWRLGDRNLYLRVPPLRGDDVAALQARLNALGFDAGREDGIFGHDTARAVRAFQREYGLIADGIFGADGHAALSGLRAVRPQTAAALREELRRLERDGMQDALLMIDPGHGGGDRGAEGPSGACESDACWDLALLLADRLVHAGARVRFTRTEIEGPDAATRATRANDADADAFVSVHLNSHTNIAAQGASTYYFPRSRAGEHLADEILARLVALGCSDCRSHPRSYPVLKETRMPAVIVEPAFITNPDEEKKIDDPDFRALVADAIAAGILGYFERA